MPRLLIVDDEQDNIDLLIRRLSWRGYEITGTLSAADGIAAAQAQKPDLILMDLKMPGMDGFEAIRRLKADDATRTIPIIALTAHAMQEDMHRALEAGADGYETKPLSINQLLEKMQTLLAPPTS
jgi:two-component system, cell cycle response regulator DivK